MTRADLELPLRLVAEAEERLDRTVKPTPARALRVPNAPGIGFNLLVRDVKRSVGFAEKVLGATATYNPTKWWQNRMTAGWALSMKRPGCRYSFICPAS
mgnify:CR=1 FL=1